MRHFIKALQIMAMVSSWSVKALEDNKVTVAEGAELVQGVCNILGVKAELEVPE